MPTSKAWKGAGRRGECLDVCATADHSESRLKLVASVGLALFAVSLAWSIGQPPVPQGTIETRRYLLYSSSQSQIFLKLNFFSEENMEKIDSENSYDLVIVVFSTRW